MRQGLILLSILLYTMSAIAKEPIKIAIIDGGLDLSDPRFIAHLCPTGHEDFTGEGIEDLEGHGTFIAGLVMQYAKDADYCMIIYKYFSERMTTKQLDKSYMKALKFAIDAHVDLVNYSSVASLPISGEYEMLKNAKKIKFVVAAGNGSTSLDRYNIYPASYKLPNVIVVGSIDENFKLTNFTNFGTRVDYYEISDYVKSLKPHGRVGWDRGTSIATAIRSGKFIHAMYPHMHISLK